MAPQVKMWKKMWGAGNQVGKDQIVRLTNLDFLKEMGNSRAMVAEH